MTKRRTDKVQTLSCIYGVHPVKELLKQKRRKLVELYVLKSGLKMWGTIKALLPKYPITIHNVDRELLNRKAGSSDHQGLVAFTTSFPFRKKFFKPEKEQFLLLLDGIQDVRNVGAIIRSAHCTGVQGIILCKKQGATLTPAALKASAGLAECMEIYEAPSISAALYSLKSAGYTLYVTALGGKENVSSITFEKPLCVIVGNEGKGVSTESKQAGTVVTLAQKTNDISYNASVATGIILFLIAFSKSRTTFK